MANTVKRAFPKRSSISIASTTRNYQDPNRNRSGNDATTPRRTIIRGQSAASLLREAALSGMRHITCCCKAIDDFLGGGVSVGRMTEFCGVSGSAKTQIGLQLALDVQLPPPQGVGGQCIYIDTANGVNAHRMHSMARSFHRHAGFATEQQMLSNVLILRCTTLEQLEDVLERLLPSVLCGRDRHYSGKFHRVKLVVVDSISFLVKYSDDIVPRILHLGQVLGRLCANFGVAVVCMNQMTSKKVNSVTRIVPALGHCWTSLLNTRVLLMMIGEQRCAKLIKSAHNAKTNAVGYFKVSNGGIRDDKRKSKTHVQ